MHLSVCTNGFAHLSSSGASSKLSLFVSWILPLHLTPWTETPRGGDRLRLLKEYYDHAKTNFRVGGRLASAFGKDLFYLGQALSDYPGPQAGSNVDVPVI